MKGRSSSLGDMACRARRRHGPPPAAAEIRTRPGRSAESRLVYTVTWCPRLARAVDRAATWTFWPPASTPPSAASGLACSETMEIFTGSSFLGLELALASESARSGTAARPIPRAAHPTRPGRRPGRSGQGRPRRAQVPPPSGFLPGHRRAVRRRTRVRRRSVEIAPASGGTARIASVAAKRHNGHAQVHGLQQGQPQGGPPQRVDVDPAAGPVHGAAPRWAGPRGSVSLAGGSPGPAAARPRPCRTPAAGPPRRTGPAGLSR